MKEEGDCFVEEAMCICISAAEHAFPPRIQQDICQLEHGLLEYCVSGILTGDASASGHMTPSFGGKTVADIGVGAGAEGTGMAATVAGTAGAGGKNAGREGRPVGGGAPGGKGGVLAATGGIIAGEPANGGKVPGGGGINPGGGAKGGMLGKTRC